MDYQQIWIKWVAYFEIEPKEREEIFNALHSEVARGFNVIASISMEELKAKLSEAVYNKIEKDLEIILALSVYQGYMLYLVSQQIDPMEAKLKERSTTDRLGAAWVEQYEKDQNKSLLMQVDPILSLFLEKAKQSRINQLFEFHPDIIDEPYKTIGLIDTFVTWAALQGFLLGVLESSLHQEEK